MTSEQHNARGTVGRQTKALPFSRAVDSHPFVEPWLQNHSRCLEDLVRGMADSQGLLPRVVRTGDDVFRLALNPKVWRVIRQVRNQRDKRWPGAPYIRVFCECVGAFHSCADRAKAFSNLAVEVRNHGE